MFLPPSVRLWSLREFLEGGVLEVPGGTQLNDSWERIGPLWICNSESVQIKLKEKSLSWLPLL